MQPNLQEVFSEQIDGAPVWIVEFQDTLDDINSNPERIFQWALKRLMKDPVAMVTHVASGLMWDVRYRNGKIEVTEVVRADRA